MPSQGEGGGRGDGRRKDGNPGGRDCQGRVTKLNEPRRIAGKPTIGIFPRTVVMPDGQRYHAECGHGGHQYARNRRERPKAMFKGGGHDRRDLTEVGFGTGGGMLMGGLAGGGNRCADRRRRWR